MAKKFTELTIGDVVYSNEKKCFRELIVGEVEAESAIGTWVLNKELTQESEIIEYHINFIATCNGIRYDDFILIKYYGEIAFDERRHTLDYGYYEDYDDHQWTLYSLKNGWKYDDARTIKITGGDDASNPKLLTWLKANGRKIASVKITNTSTTYGAVISNETLQTSELLPTESTKTFTFDVGTEIYLYSHAGGIAAWHETSISGECERTNPGTYQACYLINGDCEIVGYAYDAD